MKTIKVFGFSSHQTKERTSGVDFVRIIQPLKFLNGYQDDEVKIEVEMHDIFAEPEKSWLEIAKEFDIVYMNYTVLDWNYAAMGCFVHGEGKKIIYDIDDAIFFLRSDNVTYDQMKQIDGAYKIECMINDVDRVVTSSPYLRNVICDKTLKRHEQVSVFPNYIDLDTQYTHRSEPKNDNEITILHYGSNSHFADLLHKEFSDGIDKIMREFPNVSFITVGSFIQEFKYKWGQRYKTDFGHTDIYEWIKNHFPKFMDMADIVIAPLEIDKYNQSKSFIKFLEYSSAKKAGVYQDIRQYREVVKHGVNGYLAKTSEDWYESIKKLITDFELRKSIGEKAFETAQEYQMKNHVKEYADLIKRVAFS